MCSQPSATRRARLVRSRTLSTAATVCTGSRRSGQFRRAGRAGFSEQTGDQFDLGGAGAHGGDVDHCPTRPAEVNIDKAGVYPTLLDELLPDACHVTDRYANNRVEPDQARLKARLRPMRA